MKLLSFLWCVMRGGCRCEPAVDRRKLRNASNLHFSQTADANRRFLDNIEAENASEHHLASLVDAMTKDRP